MEFKFREKRDLVILGRKNLKDKKAELEKHNATTIIISESLCAEYQHLSYLCRRLKKDHHIEETWFFNGKLFILQDHDAKKEQILHISDLYNRFGMNVIDNFHKP